MAKRLLKQKAIELRKQGQSYHQIRQQLEVSKGTLSTWLSDYPLSKQRIRELRDWNEKRIERYIETRRRKRENTLGDIYREECSKIFPLSSREEFLCGLFLYWGEGTKANASCFALSNTDIRMARFFVRWTTKILGVLSSKIRVNLHLYSDMDIEKEKSFWSQALDIPLSQFGKPHIKHSKLSGLTHKNGFGHGTCNIVVYDAMLFKRIIMGVKSIADSFGTSGPVA